MRIFEPLRELEWRDGERLVGVYVPGARYNCPDNTALAQVLERWMADGVVKIVEQYEGTQPASVSGQGEVK